MATTPGVTLSANLQSILGSAAEAGYLRITLCGFGPLLPVVPGGTAVLADAGVPKIIGPQEGTTAISEELWGNDAIIPPGTFYEIAVLDQDKNVIQAGAYQFAQTDGELDLSQLPQYPGPYGFLVSSLAYMPCTGTIGGRVFSAPGRLVGVTYNGIFIFQDAVLPNLGYLLEPDGKTITTNFDTEPGDRIDAFCVL